MRGFHGSRAQLCDREKGEIQWRHVVGRNRYVFAHITGSGVDAGNTLYPIVGVIRHKGAATPVIGS